METILDSARFLKLRLQLKHISICRDMYPRPTSWSNLAYPYPPVPTYTLPGLPVPTHTTLVPPRPTLTHLHPARPTHTHTYPPKPFQAYPHPRPHFTLANTPLAHKRATLPSHDTNCFRRFVLMGSRRGAPGRKIEPLADGLASLLHRRKEGGRGVVGGGGRRGWEGGVLVEGERGGEGGGVLV